MAKPTQVPDFCTNDSIVDPQSGQNNVVEPDAGNKPEGWQFQQLPPRGWMNWLHNLYYKWINWLDTELEPQVTANTNALANLDSNDVDNNSTVTGSNVTAALNQLAPSIATTSTYDYTLTESQGSTTDTASISTYYDNYGIVNLTFDGAQVTVGSGGTGSISVNILPASELNPAHNTGGFRVPCVLQINGSDTPSELIITDNTTPEWYFSYWNGSAMASLFPANAVVNVRPFSASYIRSV